MSDPNYTETVVCDECGEEVTVHFHPNKVPCQCAGVLWYLAKRRKGETEVYRKVDAPDEVVVDTD